LHGVIILWDTVTSRELSMLRPPDVSRVAGGADASVWALTFSPDGRWLAAGTWKGTVIANLDNLVLRTLDVDRLSGPVRSVVFNPEGSLLAVGTSAGSIDIIEVGGWQRVRALFHGDTSENVRHDVESLAFSPDGSLLVSGGMGSGVIVWNVSTGEQVARLEHSGVHTLSFAPGGSLLASATDTVRLWETGTWRELARLPQQGRAFIEELAFSPNGRLLAAKHLAEPLIIVWNVDQGREQFVLEGEGQMTGLAFSSDGRFLASGFGRRVALWDVNTGQKTGELRGRVLVGVLLIMLLVPTGLVAIVAYVYSNLRKGDP
jgi:WD40 repeat protein